MARLCRVVVLALLFPLVVASAARAESPPSEIAVVLSNDFSPYSFPDASTGEPVGVLAELWKLWSRKTGVRVRLLSKRWGYMKPEPGLPTVYGTVAHTVAREGFYRFGKDPVSVPMYLYADRETGGVMAASDLRGRIVGVIGTGSCYGWLTARGVQVEQFATFPDIISATVGGRLSVFCSAQTAAIRYLNEFGQSERFMRSDPLFTNAIHWAVRKGDVALHALIEDGFSRITADERASIEEQWLGKPIPDRSLAWMVQIAAVAAAVGALIALALAFWSWTLRRKIAERTAELTAAVTELRAMRSDLVQRVDERTRELQIARNRAVAADRAKSEFLANMSHELRTPLNAVIGFSDVMLQRVFGDIGDARYAEYIRLIKDSGILLLDLINDLLDVSAIEAGRLDMHEEDVNVVDVIESCIRLVGDRATKANVRLESRVNALAPLVVRADGRRLKQIGLNLLTNAVKFTGDGGTVTIDAGLADDGGLSVRVVDTGMGMDEEELKTVLLPFARTQAATVNEIEGTGLGLHLVRGLVEAHGGDFNLSSEKGVGTTATVHLPADRMVSL